MLAERIEAGDFPSAVYVVAERGRVRFADALGDAVREPEPRPTTLETIYDLASLDEAARHGTARGPTRRARRVGVGRGRLGLLERV
jgi:hypothetical protein